MSHKAVLCNYPDWIGKPHGRFKKKTDNLGKFVEYNNMQTSFVVQLYKMCAHASEFEISGGQTQHNAASGQIVVFRLAAVGIAHEWNA